MVSYEAVRYRIKKKYGSASELQCVECGKTPSNWSYVGGCPNEQSQPSPSGGTWRYTTDLNYYKPMCGTCRARRATTRAWEVGLDGSSGRLGKSSLSDTEKTRVREWLEQDDPPGVNEIARRLGRKSSARWVKKFILEEGLAYHPRSGWYGERSEEYRVASSERQRGRKGKPWSDETRQKIMTSRAENGSYIFARNSKAEFLAAPILAPLGFVHTAERPFYINHPNGSRKVPDFINYKERRVVEIWGEYWHRDHDPNDWILWYNEALQGPWSCQVVWTKDLNSYLEQIRKVMPNE